MTNNVDARRPVYVQLPSDLVDALDEWCGRQPARPSRTAAIMAAIRHWLEQHARLEEAAAAEIALRGALGHLHGCDGMTLRRLADDAREQIQMAGATLRKVLGEVGNKSIPLSRLAVDVAQLVANLRAALNHEETMRAKLEAASTRLCDALDNGAGAPRDFLALVDAAALELEMLRKRLTVAEEWIDGAKGGAVIAHPPNCGGHTKDAYLAHRERYLASAAEQDGPYAAGADCVAEAVYAAVDTAIERQKTECLGCHALAVDVAQLVANLRAALNEERMEEQRMRRSQYPRCPECGNPVVGAMMTSRAVEVDGELYYHPSVISVYCLSADCNWERRVEEMKNPPEPDAPQDELDHECRECAQWTGGPREWGNA